MNKRWRRLTENEIRAARLIFSDGLDYTRIKIYRGLPFFPWHKQAVSPNGHIYFPAQHCPEDFTQAQANYHIWFIHEITHVWQYQNGYKTWLGGLITALRGGYFRQRCYRYPNPKKLSCISQLNMEQQADFIAYYYAATHLNLPHLAPDLPAFQTALNNLFCNPGNKNLLPAYFYRNQQKHRQTKFN
ncbi:hypothetical protein [Neisseria weaveri]|uniref:Type IV secretion protein Rhs n=1 Tax=Neisseria weaveri TaxID=28091 RepID=A0A448VQE9_9NEIS|nr:hypothetical protein [Neisseria weaveri]EGV38096.1 Rhs element Vgr protein [Neisseria weaveri ATCC 51223]VEJ51973.1 Uncharacterised protein [Neisseria weaveri]